MAYKSIEAFFLPPVEASIIALITAFISLVWKQILYLYCIRLGKAQHRKSLIATAVDHLADVYATIAAIIGIGVTLLGDYYNIPFTKYGDPLAGIIVSYFVIKLAYEMGKESVDILMEKNISFDELNELRKIVNEFPEVKRIDKIRARENGHYIIVDIRISVPNELSIQEGHDLCRKIKKSIMSRKPRVEEVLIHLNP
jgi:cation diffusion facilitator family transporter